MAFTYGFYDSMDGDRKYNAEQVSAIFDGLISDGVYASYGNIFNVELGTNPMQVTVDTGRAWFNHTWNLNDSKMVLTLDAADVTLARYDAIVIEVNDAPQTRTNQIRIVKGAAGSQPVKPAMANTVTLHQHPLAYIRVPGGATTITKSNIEVVVGKSECPFVTGIIQTATLDALFTKWEGDFEAWFANLKEMLNENVVANLQNQIDALATRVTTAEGKFTTRKVLVTEIFTQNTVWKNQTGKTIVGAIIRCFGGGGGASIYGNGGGGGYMSSTIKDLAPEIEVTVTIGKGGKGGSTFGGTAGIVAPENGGITSFGNMISASGGGGGGEFSGGSGGTGGGGAGIRVGSSGNSYCGCAGGNGTYGGGGGGGGLGFGKPSSITSTTQYKAGNGGNGGSYGGGGGGGGGYGNGGTGSAYKETPGGSGGTKGKNGGAGGAGGNGGTYGGNVSTTSAKAGSSGVSTLGNAAVEAIVRGGGLAGTYGATGSANGGAGGGGGGGGYGGNGGAGGNGVGVTNGSSNSWAVNGYGGGGGGGGGYGGNGGAGGAASSDPISSSSSYAKYYGAGGGGGGGGYGGNGGAGGGFNNRVGALEAFSYFHGGGGGGYGTSNYGKGGEGYETVVSYNQNIVVAGSGRDGIIILTYYKEEVVPA